MEALAARQHGVVARRQLTSLGTTRRQIDTMLAAGRLAAAFPGVYRVAGAPVTDRQRCWAALLWAGDDAVLSHRSAARLWQLDGIDADLPELWSARNLRSESVIVHRGEVATRDRGRLDGLKVTSPSRTLIDLAAVVDEADLETAIEHARRRRLVSLDRLHVDARRIARRGRPGTRDLRQLLRALDGRAACESALEVKVARILRSSGVPAPVNQFAVEVRGRRFRIDFAWPRWRVGIECEGFGIHGRRRAFDPDRDRLAHLASAHWRIIPVTWEQTHDPERLVRLVSAAISEAAS